jgi:hypothetical protein
VYVLPSVVPNVEVDSVDPVVTKLPLWSKMVQEYGGFVVGRTPSSCSGVVQLSVTVLPMFDTDSRDTGVVANINPADADAVGEYKLLFSACTARLYLCPRTPPVQVYVFE